MLPFGLVEPSPHPGGAHATGPAADQAPRYPEGTGLCLQVTSARDLPLVKKLVLIKLAH